MVHCKLGLLEGKKSSVSGWSVYGQMFIDKQIAANKTIFLTNSPFELYLFESGELRFYQRELNYLTELGYRFEKVGTNLWIAIKN